VSNPLNYKPVTSLCILKGSCEHHECIKVVWHWCFSSKRIHQAGHRPKFLEFLEYSGISLNMENSGNHPGILFNIRGKNCNKQNISCSSFKYLCKSLVLFCRSQRVVWPNCWWSYGMTLDDGHYYKYLTYVITYGKVSLWLWRSLENSRSFSPTLWLPSRWRLYEV